MAEQDVMSEDDSAGSSIAGMTGAVMGSMLPFGCMYGCVVSLMWLLGGGLIGLIIATILRHHQ
jgi:hypothetical protein